MADDSPQARKSLRLQAMANGSPSRPVARSEADAAAPDVGAAMDFVAESSAGPLPAEVRADVEGRAGVALGDVGVHRDQPAQAAALALHATAFTTGSDIYLGPDATPEVMAEEAAHVAQFRRGELGSGPGVTSPTDPVERSAKTFAQGGRLESASSSAGFARDVMTKPEWKDATRKYRVRWMGWRFGRTDLLRVIDKAVEEYHQARDGWMGVKDLPRAGLDAVAIKMIDESRRTYIDTAFELERSIREWQEAKGTKEDGTVDSIRAAEAATLLTSVQEEIAAIQASPEQAAVPAQGAAWGAEGAFTDPAQHDPAAYRYIINGVTPGTDYRERIQADPELFRQNAGLISVSVIDQAKNSVWAPSGYLLRVPAGSVVAAGPHDLASNSQLAKPKTTLGLESERLNTKFGIASPQQMTGQTPADGHNEAAVIRDGLDVAGIFVVQDPEAKGTPIKAYKLTGRQVDGKEVVEKVPTVSDAWMDNYRATAEKIGVPIVWLDQSEGAVIGALKSMDMIPLGSFQDDQHVLLG